MDRIVREIIAKDAEAEFKRKEDIRLEPFRSQMKTLFQSTNIFMRELEKEYSKDSLFAKSSLVNGYQWKVGDKLKIKLPDGQDKILNR